MASSTYSTPLQASSKSAIFMVALTTRSKGGLCLAMDLSELG